MNTRFELLSDDRGRVAFFLLDNDGEVLLEGLPSQGKIGAQTEVMQTRKAIVVPGQVIPHKSREGKHFVVVKNAEGDVVARSPHVDSKGELDALVAEIGRASANAAIIDHSGRVAQR